MAEDRIAARCDQLAKLEPMIAEAQRVQYRAIVSALRGLADAVLASIHVDAISCDSAEVTIESALREAAARMGEIADELVELVNEMEPEQRTVFVDAFQEALELPEEQEA